MLRPRQKVPHNQLQYSVLAAILIVFTYSYLLPYAIIQSPYREHKYQPAVPLPRDIASNSTLGFQKIFALSTGPSWRTRGLLASAAYTGVDIQIPRHTYSTNELAEAFQNIGPDDVIHPAFGSTMAWLAHLDMIKFVVANDFDTVLILEDDVDWDITLKNQMRLVSDSVRGFTASDAEDATPYGRLWDILWIGHCGEETDPTTPRLEFPDSTAPSRANYTGWSKKYMTNLQDGHRVVQYGVNPVCTFAYAVSRTGAQKILEWAGKGQDEAYDIRLMWGCKKRELNCITVTPEIMHHYTPLTELGYVSLVDEKDDEGHSVDEASFEKVMGATENIVNSTRCKVLFNSPCVKKFREQ